MSDDREHSYIPTLKRELAERRIDRREFLRTATLLGMAAPAAYALADTLSGSKSLVAPASAQGAIPKGGTIRIGMRCQDLKSPHTYSWVESSNAGRLVYDYLTVTGVDNVTRPSLCTKWEATEDLKSWTLHLRRDVKWHSGRIFTADDVIWNLKRVLDAKTGSSVLGLFKGVLLEEYDGGEKDSKGAAKKSTRLWDASAIEKIDDFTVRLNGKAPQLAVPENLFHYPLMILDPEGGGVHKVGANGTGAFTMVEDEVGRRQVYRPNRSYWAGAPHVDEWQYIDLGDEAAAHLSAIASKQVDGLYLGEVTHIDAMKQLAHVQMYDVPTAYTAVARFHAIKPFDDRRVRQAMRYAIDCAEVLKISYHGLGQAGEHHHVALVHPEYARLAPLTRDIARSKKLLAEAGYANGIDAEIIARPQPAWELVAVQAMVEQWREAGIRVNINIMPSAQYWDVWTKVPFGFTTWAHRPLGVMTLGLAYRTGVPWNESNYSNAEFDKLLSESEGILDVDKRRAVVAKLEAILQDDGPIVQPVWRSLFTFMDKRVKGFRMHPTGYIFGHEIGIEA